jgi:hypothetical protein
VVDRPVRIELITPLAFTGNGPVTIPVEVTGRGRLLAVRGTLSPKGCGSGATGGSHSCTLTESEDGFELRAIPASGARFDRWGSTISIICKRAQLAECAANVGYDGPELAAVFSG